MIREIVPGVHKISLAWSNSYLLTDGEDAVLIDTGLRQDRERLLAALKRCGITTERLRAVYLTHAHCDHAGNAAYLAGDEEGEQNGFSAQLYTHCAEMPYLGLPRQTYQPQGKQALTRPLTGMAFALGEQWYPVTRCAKVEPLIEGDLVDAPGGPLRVIACPGHTPGHIAYFRERDGLLFSGDAILNIVPIKRVRGLSLAIPLFTYDLEGARQSARHLATLRPAALLAGHGWPLMDETAAQLDAWAHTL